MKLRVIGDDTFVELMNLFGVKGASPKEPSEIFEVIQNYCNDSEVGIVLVQSSYAAKLGDRWRLFFMRRQLPLVIQIPDKHQHRGIADEIRDYLGSRLGIRL